MIPFICVISTGNAVADPGEGPGGPDPRLFSVQAGARRAETEKKFFGDQPPPLSNGLEDPPPRPLSQGLDLAIQCCAGIPAGGGGGYSHTLYYYTGMCRPTGLWFWSFWFGTLYPFLRCFLERGIIFRTHESSSFVSSHLKLFKDRLLLKIRFNALTSKLLYSCCTLRFSVQGGRILVRPASADSERVHNVPQGDGDGLKRILEQGIGNWPISRTGYQF